MLSATVRKTLPNLTLDVAIEAPSGITGVLGPSGAGKTTLLNCIAGLSTPDAGRIQLDGRTLFDRAAKCNLPPNDRRIGYVFQEARLFPHMSVRSNLTYGAPSQPRLNAFEEIVGLMGLEMLLDRRPATLSGGERRRVAIGRALLAEPQTLLMDEPLTNLDPRRRADILPFLEVIPVQLNLPILYVTHQLEEIIRLADQLVILQNGQVAAHGPVDQVLNQRHVQELLLGENISDTDSETILSATIDAQDTAFHLTRLSIGGPVLTLPHIDQPPASSIRLRIRARDVSIATAKPEGLSIQNCLPAKIAALHPLANAQLELDLQLTGAAPQTPLLKARITRKAAQDLDLAPGLHVWALIKSVALAANGHRPLS